MTRSIARNKKPPSSEPITIETDPINLSSPPVSPSKKTSKKTIEDFADILSSQKYSSHEVSWVISDLKKEKGKGVLPEPQEEAYVPVDDFISHSVASDPLEKPSAAKFKNQTEKLKEDVMIVEVLERHLKQENGNLKERVHKLQDKYDHLKVKYKELKKQLKKRDRECLELKSLFELAKANSPSLSKL